MLLVMLLKQLRVVMLRLLPYGCVDGGQAHWIINSSSSMCSWNEWA
jgi:hypothetical protein